MKFITSHGRTDYKTMRNRIEIIKARRRCTPLIDFRRLDELVACGLAMNPLFTIICLLLCCKTGRFSIKERSGVNLCASWWHTSSLWTAGCSLEDL